MKHGTPLPVRPTYFLSTITEGSCIVIDGELTSTSYSETTVTMSRKTALTVSCHDQSESGTKDNGV